MKKKKVCVNCHFLVQRYRDAYTKPNGEEIKGFVDTILTPEERKELKKGDFGSIECRMCCHFLVWHEGDLPEENDKRRIINEITRKDCFYFEYRPNMLVEAAEILQEREYNLREKEKDRRYTRIALYIAVAALVINTIIQILFKD